MKMNALWKTLELVMFRFLVWELITIRGELF